MFGTKKAVEKSYGIIGLGRFGMALAISLADAGKDILVMDYKEDVIKEMRRYTENAFVVKTLDRKTLEDTGVQNCDVVIICIGESIDTSILTTLNVIEMGVPKVISKASTADQGKVLERIGAEVVYPEKDMAIRLAKKLASNRLMDFLELRGNVDISEILLSDDVDGKTILDLDVRRRFGLNIIAIERDSEIITEIMPDMKLRMNDRILVIGNSQKINAFTDNLSEK